MSFHDNFDRLTCFLLNLECLDMAGQEDAFVHEALETGGTFPLPCDDDYFDMPALVIDLHEVRALGRSLSEAIRNWKKAARERAPLPEDDGFITVYPPFENPRNHAEEIVNVRAAAVTGAT